MRNSLGAARAHLAVLAGCFLLGCGAERKEHELRLGYMPRLTHAPALVGLKQGNFQGALGKKVHLRPHAFEVGNAAVQALLANQLDVAYLGPNPAISGYVRSEGQSLAMVAASTFGGSRFIARGGVDFGRDKTLAQATLASPQTASTQDIALRRYLRTRGLRSALEGGTVRILPLAPAFTFQLMQQGQVDAAWVSEPLASQLLTLPGASTLVDERSQWPDGRYLSVVVVARTAYLKRFPERIRAMLKAHQAAIQELKLRRGENLELALAFMEETSGRKIEKKVAEQAFRQLHFDSELELPLLLRAARHATAAGFLPKTSLEGLLRPSLTSSRAPAP